MSRAIINLKTGPARKRSVSFFKAGAVLLVLLAGFSLFSCRRHCRSCHPEKLVTVGIKNLGVDPASGNPVVFLEDVPGRRVLPIWIGEAEARAILSEMKHENPPRPMTHDLFLTLLRQIQGRIQSVVITEVKGNTFFARVEISRGKERIYLDSRPSDAIALALRARAPIYVAAALFARENGALITGPSPETPGKVFSSLGVRLQTLTAELALQFQAKPAQGLLVSSVEADGPADREGMQTGDIIIEAGGVKLTSLSDLEKITPSSGEELELVILRGNERSRLHLKSGTKK
jgi:bifunctional DNase/RNase